MVSNLIRKLNIALVKALEYFHLILKYKRCRLLLDINECELGIGKCPANKECVNIPGGYDCADSKKTSTQYVQHIYSIISVFHSFKIYHNFCLSFRQNICLEVKPCHLHRKSEIWPARRDTNNILINVSVRIDIFSSIF